MDTAIIAEFTAMERNVMQLCTNTNQGIVGAFSKEDLVMQHLSIMSMIAKNPIQYEWYTVSILPEW